MAADGSALKEKGFLQQRQEGRFSLRIKVIGGQLTAAQLRGIAEIAEQYGQGYAHMTSRQGVEIPHICLKDIEAVQDAMTAGGLVSGIVGPRVRTITACQGRAVCRSAWIETTELARELVRRYGGCKLPHKFKIGITGCHNNCLKAEENDLGIKGGVEIRWEQDRCTLCGACSKGCRAGALTQRDQLLILNQEACCRCGRCVRTCSRGAISGQAGYSLYCGGTFGNAIHPGKRYLPLILDRKTLLRAVDAVVCFYGEKGIPGERLTAALERVGEAGLAQALYHACHTEGCV